MKTIWTFFLALIITANLAKAQDSLYVYKAGTILYKQAVTGVDSITFYKDNHTVTDIDGNVYKTVTIGTQTWMVENLKVTHYRDGSAIPNITNATTWTSLTTGAYCDYNNLTSNGLIYGHQYNWLAAVDTRNIAPIGWHVPTNAEWNLLSDYLGGATVAGGKLKEAGTTHWASPNTGATNSSGFTALPGGNRSNINGTFDSMSTYGRWWSTTESSTTSAWTRNLNYYYSNIFTDTGGNAKSIGCSIRCVKD